LEAVVTTACAELGALATAVCTVETTVCTGDPGPGLGLELGGWALFVPVEGDPLDPAAPLEVGWFDPDEGAGLGAEGEF
jgi:hypothetical protein